MTTSKRVRKVLDLLYNVPAEGRKVIPGFCELSTPEYGVLRYSILHKDKIYWRNGRAGFWFTSDGPGTRLPGYEEEFSGVWIFPGADLAIEKRSALMAEGWVCKFYSWPD